ncbi:MULTISPECIES: DUF397 domain-containing protein [Streptomyces]|uniref:DUF397 domain-containing protein n=1 Tax=Streptomyces TaxID=1883 RepID=UPI00067AF4D0|nr:MULTISPECIES: DUF397 domain-containing protein [Streptomyces]KOT58003.1 DNA-binding protein [Streptomyces rimosus subsp. rimosus]
MSPTEPSWFKSSYSGSAGDDCVEIATTPTTIRIRDSKNITGPHLAVPADAWAAFLTLVDRGHRPQLHGTRP